MKRTARRFPTLFRSRKSKERKAYLRDSLDTSFQLSDRLADWSRSNDPRARLCVMRFHKKWRHSNCPVMKWYNLQTCKQFKSIQHWRNLDTQFYHEFIIVLLADGSVCRVERMGEGSRTDAIRQIGCTAYDLIKWFSAEDHAAKRWHRGSEELIVQVDLPNTFDLLDVLAVCYTIQRKSPRASVYTLQRYNCYFLCNTILVMITRRVAEWETQITDADWPTIVDNMIDELRDKSLLPVKEQQGIDFFALGVCSLLDPQSPDPAGFLLEPLRLDLKNRGHKSVNGSLSNLLWYKYSDSVINSKVFGYFDDVVETALENPAPESAAFKLKALMQEVDGDRFPPTGLDLPSLKKTMAKEIFALCSSLAKEAVTLIKWEAGLQELENKPSISWRIFGSMAGFLASAIPASLLLRIFSFVAKMDKDEDELDGVDVVDDVLRLTSRIGVTMSQAIAAIPRTTRLDLVKSLITIEDPEDLDADGYDHKGLFQDFIDNIFSKAAECLFPTVLKVLQPDSELPNVPATLAFLNVYLLRELWEGFIRGYMNRVKKDDLHSLFSRKAATLVVRSINGTQETTLVSTVADFQTHIQQRIQQHAERVQSFQLASAPLVLRDIERSMSEVWESLPTGFGARMVENSSEDNEIQTAHIPL